jgi:hypothetical protein
LSRKAGQEYGTRLGFYILNCCWIVVEQVTCRLQGQGAKGKKINHSGPVSHDQQRRHCFLCPKAHDVNVRNWNEGSRNTIKFKARRPPHYHFPSLQPTGKQPPQDRQHARLAALYVGTYG